MLYYDFIPCSVLCLILPRFLLHEALEHLLSHDITALWSAYDLTVSFVFVIRHKTGNQRKLLCFNQVRRNNVLFEQHCCTQRMRRD